MENSSHLNLTDYQRAVLAEMGVSYWHLADAPESSNKQLEQAPPEQSTPSDKGAVADSTLHVESQPIPQEQALAKLQALKGQSQSIQSTDAVLLTWTEDNSAGSILQDVLLAMELDTNSQKQITVSELERYADYPLAWKLGGAVVLSKNMFITPALDELTPEHKKQLWHQIQQVTS